MSDSCLSFEKIVLIQVTSEHYFCNQDSYLVGLRGSARGRTPTREGPSKLSASARPKRGKSRRVLRLLDRLRNGASASPEFESYVVMRLVGSSVVSFGWVLSQIVSQKYDFRKI